MLRADSIRPYSCGGRAADGSTNSRPLQMACTIQRTAQFRGLRADSIRPYSSGREAAAIWRTAQLRTRREAKSLPYMASAILQSSCKSIRFCLKMAEKNGII